jgi:hypothetical protein
MQVFDRRLNLLMCIIDIGDFGFNAPYRSLLEYMHHDVYMLLT